MSDMNGRVTLITGARITGASSGIGRATAELFAVKGARVVSLQGDRMSSIRKIKPADLAS
jgi:NADP-dependent 3-hydroxy acid dehydrogenase YdfG